MKERLWINPTKCKKKKRNMQWPWIAEFKFSIFHSGTLTHFEESSVKLWSWKGCIVYFKKCLRKCGYLGILTQFFNTVLLCVLIQLLFWYLFEYLTGDFFQFWFNFINETIRNRTKLTFNNGCYKFMYVFKV